MIESSKAAPRNIVALWYTRVFETLGGGAMLIIVVAMTSQVLARYVFNSSLIWAEELCRYLLIWITFMLIGLAFQRGELVALDIFTRMLMPRTRFIVKVLVSIPIILFLFVVMRSGYTFADRMSMQSIPALDFIWSSIAGRDKTLDVSIFWVYGSVSAGAALLIIHFVVALFLEGRAVFWRGGDPGPDQPEVPMGQHGT